MRDGKGGSEGKRTLRMDCCPHRRSSARPIRLPRVRSRSRRNSLPPGSAPRHTVHTTVHVNKQGGIEGEDDRQGRGGSGGDEGGVRRHRERERGVV